MYLRADEKMEWGFAMKLTHTFGGLMTAALLGDLLWHVYTGQTCYPIADELAAMAASAVVGGVLGYTLSDSSSSFFWGRKVKKVDHQSQLQTSEGIYKYEF